MRFGMGEILVVLLIVVLLFGARKLPELAKSLGQSIKEFKNSLRASRDDLATEDKK